MELARSVGREFELEPSADNFHISGLRKLIPSATVGIAVCKLKVALLDDEAARAWAIRPPLSDFAKEPLDPITC